MRRQFRAVVYAGLGGTAANSSNVVLGEWWDISAPQFRQGFDGAGDLTLTLARRVGYRDDDSEMADDTLRHGNRVDIWVADNWSLRNTSSGGRHIYRGIISRIKGIASPEVTLLPMQYVYEHMYIGTVTPTNTDTIEAARYLVETYGGAVPWDHENPYGSGIEPASVQIENQMLMGALRAYAAATGTNWHVFVSPQGVVRFIDDNSITTGTVHQFTHGENCAADLDALETDSTEQVRRIVMAYQDAGGVKRTSIATADDWAQDFPRDLFFSWNERISIGLADAITSAMLIERNRVALRATVTVYVTQYDIDTIRIGDRVQLRIPRPFPMAEVTQVNGGYTEIRARIAEINYLGNAVELSIDTPGVSMSRLLARAAIEARELGTAVLAPS